MAFKSPTDWVSGEIPSAAHLNEPLPIVRSVASIIAGDGTGLVITQSEQGTTISRAPNGEFHDSFLGVITSTGPSGAADYTDCRYWIKPVAISSTTDENGLIFFVDNPPAQGGDGVYAEPYPFTAINLAELTNITTGAGTHVLGTNGTVYVKVWPMRNLAGAENRHYVFHEVPKYIVKVTGDASGGGKYTGVLMYQTATGTIPVTGNLSETEIGAVQAVTVTVLNIPELGAATHDLTSGTPKNKYFHAIRSPRRASDDTIVFIINGLDWEACT
jgi:hypothetical protein